MRLLHAGHPARVACAARRESETYARRDSRGARGQPLPVHRRREDPGSGRDGSDKDGGLSTPSRPPRDGGEATFSVIGKSFPRVDGGAKVTGQAVYADDVVLPRTLHCKFLRSPHPHARIISIDTSAARRIPGVKAVITGADLPVKFGILPVTQDERALEHEKVRYVGDPIAAVAATDEETAAAACDAIAVEYEVFEPVMSIEEALRAPKGERIQDYGGPNNIHKLVALEFGDMDGGFAKADHIREDVFFFQGNTHLPMEQHSAIATYIDGKVTLWSSTQVVHYVHRALAKVLELPMNRIRVIGAAHGGGFGGKTDPFAHEIVVSKLAMITGRPVKCTLTREEVFYAHRGRHPVLMWVRTGVTRDGLITAMHFKSALDGGAYGYGDRKRLPGHGMGFAISSYLSGAGTAIYWNDMPHSEVQIKVDRGGVTAYCGAMDIGQGSDSVLAAIVAEQLGLQPKDVRLVTADSDTTPIDLGSYSSRVTFMAGNAALEAARKMRLMLVEAVEATGRKYEDVKFEEACVLAEAKFGTLVSAGSYTPPKIAGPYKGSGVGPSPAYSYSACVVDLDADARTGQVRVNKVWIAHDVGRAINPLLVEGQVEGSVYMGLGEALMEEQEFRKGLHKWPSMLEYKSPTFLDMPDVETFIVETNDPEGPYGAKEAGQGPLLPVPPAVCAAVHDALGVWIDEIPVTPEKVIEALRRKGKGEEHRYGPQRFPPIPYPPTIKVEPPPKDAAATAAP